MKLSIITVSYNSVSTIEQTFKSVLNQSYENIEYIVIDGGSSDGTLDIIKKYSIIFNEKSLDFRYISEKDNGIFDAMNKGINLATGDWIGIINSDDYYENEIFDIIIESINKNLNIDVVFGNLKFIEKDNSEKILSPNLDFNKLCYNMTIFHPTVFVKAYVYKKFGLFDLKYKLSSDWEILLRFHKNKCSFHYLNVLIANFRNYGAGSQFKYSQLVEKRNIRHLYTDNYLKYLYDLNDFRIYFKHRFNL